MKAHQSGPLVVHRREMQRRAFLAAPFLLPGMAHAQTWPARPVRIVVGFLAGGSNDILARLLAAHLLERFPGSSFVIDNRPGAGALIATEHVARAAPDGYTVLFASLSTVLASLINRHAQVNVARDFAPIGLVSTLPLLVLTRADSPIRTVADMIDAARRSGGRLTVSHPGVGAINHLSLVLLMRQAGIELTLVPFIGNPPSLNAGLRGDVDLVSDSLFGARSLIESGQLRPIAYTGAERLASQPEVPTFAETIPGYEVTSWNGMLAPRGTPEPVLDALNDAIGDILRRPDVIERIRGFGGEAAFSSRAEFRELIANDTQRWTRVLNDVNVSTD